MSSRIEVADPLTLLTELPARWAQVCITTQPHDLPVLCLLAVLEETRRVLREDGALWLTLTRAHDEQHIIGELLDAGWQHHPTPRTSPLRLGGFPGLLGFTKGSHPFQTVAPRRLGRMPACGFTLCRRGCSRTRPARRAWCVPCRKGYRDLPRPAVEWCIRRSTVSRACGVCGTPWHRLGAHGNHAGRWRPLCNHVNDRGRCLVLDPFCGSSSNGLAATRLGRDFLGIQPSPQLAERIRQRLTTERGR